MFVMANHILEVESVTFILIIVATWITTNKGVSAATMVTDAPQRPICLYHVSDKVRLASTPEDLISGRDELLDDGTVMCDAPTDYCFSYMQVPLLSNGSINANSSEFMWLVRGCFKNAHSCNTKSCIATGKGQENRYFCCCKGNYCNDNIDFQEALRVTPSPPETEVNSTTLDPYKMLIIIMGCLSIVMVLFGCVVLYKLRRKKKPLNGFPLGFDKSPTSPCIDLNNLTFLEMLGHGRYGTAHRALLGDEEVAVKLFPHHHKSSFSNEKYIYSLPLMEHSNLLSFLGGGEILGPEGNSCYGLVLSYCSRGKLSSFLQENTLDWATFCRIAISATSGLAHLHSDVRRGDLIKPCVAHRDYNTRNILLKENLTCVVSDLGFAIHTQGAKFYINGEEQLAEMASLTDVGTLRYMAPEVLEGAVNLRDCETSLKQIDIYALGLVLWEIASRCHDLYQGTETPLYALPFQAEIGLHPSFEQMQVLVARNKARPLYSPYWKDSNPAIKRLKQTIGECWDNDAEARLSAICVEKRLEEIQTIWGICKNSLGMKSISPTTNSSSGSFLSNVKAADRGNVISNELSLPKDRELHSQQRDSSVSETTVETTIPFSPSDNAIRILGKNHAVEAVNVVPFSNLQPHQGRNPCIERNTITEHSKEPNICGNDLLGSSDKYSYSNLEIDLNNVNLLEVLESQRGIDSSVLNEHLVPLLNRFLIPSRQPPPTSQTPPTQFHTHSVPPIPYLQNEMRGGEGRPKQQNIAREAERRNEIAGGGWKRWKATWEERLVALLPRRRHRHQYEDEEQQGILVTPTSSSFSEPPTPLAPFNPSIVQNGHPQQPVQHQTQVLLTNGAPYTVISNWVEPSQTRVVAPQNVNPPVHLPSRPLLAETEIGIAKLQFQQGLTPIVRSRQGSKDSGINKSSENSASFIDSDSSLDKFRRPTTLLLHSRGDRNCLTVQTSYDDTRSESEKNSAQGDHVKLRKPKHRIKTPKCPLLPRLSLYDDSIMAGNIGDVVFETTMSRSLPLDINTVGNRNKSLHIEHQSSDSSLNDKNLNICLNMKPSARSDSTSSGNSTSENSVCKSEEGIPNSIQTMKASNVETFKPSPLVYNA